MPNVELKNRWNRCRQHFSCRSGDFSHIYVIIPPRSHLAKSIRTVYIKLGMRFPLIILCLIPFTSPVPQYLPPPGDEKSAGYIYRVGGGYALWNADGGKNVYSVQPSYSMTFYPGSYPSSDDSIVIDRHPQVPQVSAMSPVPPVLEAEEFTKSQPETEGYYGVPPILSDRGRSDIDPEDDNDMFGYVYPKPAIPFELPNFQPLGGTSIHETPAMEEETKNMTTEDGGDLTTTEPTTAFNTSETSSPT